MNKFHLESQLPREKFFVGEQFFDTFDDALTWFWMFAVFLKTYRITHQFEENKFQEVVRMFYKNNDWDYEFNELYFKNFDGINSHI
jgi:hypothetical protein